MYYVYKFYRTDTGEVLYIGKGTGNRYKVRNGRNALLANAFLKYECESEIIKYFEDEKEAFEYEDELIEKYKKLGECSCNMHKGGAGGSGEYWTEELRHEYSVNNVMKSKEQRERMSKNNPMKNSEIASIVAKKKSKPVVINGIEYQSIAKACETYSTCPETIRSWCAKGVNSKGELCRFKDKEQVVFTDKRYNKGGSRQVTYDGKIYEAVIDLANDIGKGETTIHSWLRRGFSPDGKPCRYLNDDRQLVFENKYVSRNKRKAKPVIVNGIRYSSCSEASLKLGIRKPLLYSYLNKSKFNENIICEYDNQQPSRGNTDMSTTEGSTTNG